MDDEQLVRIPLKMGQAHVQREIVLAVPNESHDTFIVRSIPAFAYGVAYGDVIRVLDQASGDFEVLEHNGQVTVRVFVRGSLEKPEIRSLINDILGHKGLYEVGKASDDPDHLSLLLISLDVKIGFPEIEEILSSVKHAGHQWEYGNIYDENGRQLSWWNRSV
ncbi:DUF4265 domain-containing protein [Massilia horti]|uniref:DUF4265 domain-containing protein n=1 Tax=Massilia horti TaxID=2562153 RepID=A0A4Y9T6Q2_9BURK|nr:DUF4265 domain-containing protein [Massilia horti]TFW33710.1 DUF4265 domain-containing protein [Massilia horti]